MRRGFAVVGWTDGAGRARTSRVWAVHVALFAADVRSVAGSVTRVAYEG
jgi:hypothetical protein